MNTQLNDFSKGTIVVHFDYQTTIESNIKTAFIFSDSTNAELPLYVLTLEAKHQILMFRNDVVVEFIVDGLTTTLRSNSEMIDLGVNPNGINIFKLVLPTLNQF
nr:MAG TPA: hypothetical protein [Caudoviricetes sp.]